MFIEIKSFPINQDTWYINVLFGANNSQEIEKFTGQLNYLDYFDIRTIKNLVISLQLTEIICNVDYTEWLQETIKFSEQYFICLKNIYIIRENAILSSEQLHTRCNLHVSNINYFLLRSTDNYIKFNFWDAENKKVLFLIGDIRNRPHRFPILYEFYHTNSLHLLEYSLHTLYSNDNFSWLIDYLNSIYNLSLDKPSFYELYESLRKVIPNDNYFEEAAGVNGPDVSITVHPPSYNETALCLVTESHFETPSHFPTDYLPFSEKIWKPLLFSRPFVIPSARDIAYSTLEKFGFKTFLEYTDFPNKANFDHLSTNDCMYQYTKLTYNRIFSFLNNMKLYKSKIIQDIEYNFLHWQKISDIEWNNFFDSCPPLQNIPKKSIGILLGCGPGRFLSLQKDYNF